MLPFPKRELLIVRLINEAWGASVSFTDAFKVSEVLTSPVDAGTKALGGSATRQNAHEGFREGTFAGFTEVTVFPHFESDLLSMDRMILEGDFSSVVEDYGKGCAFDTDGAFTFF